MAPKPNSGLFEASENISRQSAARTVLKSMKGLEKMEGECKNFSHISRSSHISPFTLM